MLNVHAYPAAIFKDFALHAFAGSTDDHFETSLLTRPPDVGGLAAQGSFVEVALGHGRNYILASFFTPCYNNKRTDELTTVSIEKWATPTFLLVIHSAARITELKI